MIASTEKNCINNELVNSNTLLTNSLQRATWMEKTKNVFKKIKCFFRETTVEPCLFMYMLCTSLSSLVVQNMHLEKSCRVNFNFGEDICDRIRDLNTTGLENELNQVQILVANVIAWKFPLQTAIPAVMVLFVGAWSDKYKKRKICILFPFTGEIVTNIGLLFATHYFKEISLIGTALIEALPAAFTGSYIIIFMGMYSFMADRTTVENRTFRLGIVTIFVSFGTPTGTVLSGILLRALGYYGVFSLLIVLHSLSFLYGLFRLEDIVNEDEITSNHEVAESRVKRVFRSVFDLVGSTILVALRPRASNGRFQIFIVIVLYLLMVGPLYGDSQVSYLYARRKFQLNEVEYSIYGTINILLGFVGTIFCISVLSKMMAVQDSTIGGLAGVSRIAACFVFAFAPTRPWYYAAPLFNIFSHTGLTAVRSIATKSVPTEEIAKLSALIGVTEAIAPSIYMPISSHIYSMTIETFPGAFYLFDATLTAVALGFFAVIYLLVRRRMRDLVTDPKRKEDFARSNEVSRF
ncbi:proton-coupled folate transporter-like [Plodia interpunctella]|uniref:proton-coupled folate transporter-like n=1 Tax=Plodia interpunctella TaxID=58824 RepID=UPI0023676591|nr:proton-coupled folate transporter-like [Plodia interpunctella]